MLNRLYSCFSYKSLQVWKNLDYSNTLVKFLHPIKCRYLFYFKKTIFFYLNLNTFGNFCPQSYTLRISVLELVFYFSDYDPTPLSLACVQAATRTTPTTWTETSRPTLQRRKPNACGPPSSTISSGQWNPTLPSTTTQTPRT